MDVIEQFDQQEMESRNDYAIAVATLEKIVEDAQKLQGAARAAFLKQHRAMRDEVIAFLSVYGSEQVTSERPSSEPTIDSSQPARVSHFLRNDQFAKNQLAA